MKSVTVRVPAKINLSLGVGPVRADGFHSLATVYQAVNLFDEVRVSETDDDTLTVTVHFEGDRDVEHGTVPLDDDNLAIRAAKLVRDAAGLPDAGAALAIRKSIPVSGGMAGGSADAAAALLACNELWRAGLSRDKLDALAARLGSDVPFLLHGGIAIGSGRGEKVSPVLARGHYHWVFAIAAEGLSTAAVYAEFDSLNEQSGVAEPDVPGDLMSALRAGDATELGRALTNDLAEAAVSLRPELAKVIEVGWNCDALGVEISGSGPTVMFLASDEAHALDVAVALASSRVCADVVQATGPAQGARIIT